jgi:hypothetical protein
MVCGPSAGIRGRLGSHHRTKPDQWTHFSVFKVWDNISQQAVRELEGIVRHVFRKDPRVNPLAVQRGFKPLKKLARDRTRAAQEQEVPVGRARSWGGALWRGLGALTASLFSAMVPPRWPDRAGQN